MVQISITPIQNYNLFSQYYLENLIGKNPEWEDFDHILAFNEIKEIYHRETPFLEHVNEKQLEERYYKPIFKVLGFEFEVTEATESREFPDYALFPDRPSLDDAHINKGTLSFFTNALAIGEVKAWDVDLDKFGKDEFNRNRNPSLQLWIYLHVTEPKWGILSNGRLWRLYFKDRRRDDYYEVDLPSLILSDNIEGFKSFYYFFRKDSFLPSRYGEAFLNRVLQGSADYARAIGVDLKENVYRAMKNVAEGFIEWRPNHLDISDPNTLKLVQNNTMILLYRFLFLLYAEGKGLLDLGNLLYRDNYSFYRLKREVKDKADAANYLRYQPVSTTLLSRLRDLFRLIDQGSESFGISKNDFYIPAYNGGLFDPEKHPELESWLIGDSFLAEAIDLLSRSSVSGGQKEFVDYSTLEIRHLGSIYEGLLEYRLKVADKDYVVDDGDWITLEEYTQIHNVTKTLSDFNEFDKVEAGKLYLATDKGERKLTGSFYTPDYVVNYIVKNTIEPVVRQRWIEAEQKCQSYVSATLSLKVLDPAMGSGHFLVGAVEYLAQKLLEAVQMDLYAGRIADASNLTTDWARREVVSHCIYGVDLNELAVELAKVGLWLTTISKDRPLSFLDHRLKQGNSLVGARLSNLRFYPGTETSDTTTIQTELPASISPRFIGHILNKIAELETVEEIRVEDIKQKERIFNEFKQLPEYRKAKGLANVYTAISFGLTIPAAQRKNEAGLYQDLVWAIAGDEAEWRRKTNFSWFSEANVIARNLSFFHWELEYPEIYLEGGKVKDNPGWDVIIGNPPYIPIEMMTESERKYYPTIFKELERKYDTSILFLLAFAKEVKKDGHLGYLSSITWQTGDNYAKVRDYLIHNVGIKEIINLPYDVFEEAYVDTGIYILKGEPLDEYSIFSFPKQEKSPDLNGLKFDRVQISLICQPDYKIILNPGMNRILARINENSLFVRLGDITTSTQGLAGNKYSKLSTNEGDNILPFLAKGQVYRYNLVVEEIIFVSMANKQNLIPFYGPGGKVLIRRIINRQDRLMATYTDKSLVFTKDINPFLPRNTQLDAFYLLSLINSKLLSYLYINRSGIATKDDFRQTTLTALRQLPIRNIFFTTPAERRIELFEEFKHLYQGFISNADHRPILEFIGERLSANPEESDVIHDALVYLAKQIVIRVQKVNKEIKVFLDFIEAQIGAPIIKLSNKTAIQKYYTNSFTKFIDALSKNKRNLKSGYNPKSPSNYRLLQEWYDESVGIIKQLDTEVMLTDSLIDRIVYRIYGLSEQEIQVIEGKQEESESSS